MYITIKIVQWDHFYVEAHLLQSRNYSWYIPENESEVEILGWTLSNVSDSANNFQKF